jgi:hypothetical protein
MPNAGQPNAPYASSTLSCALDQPRRALTSWRIVPQRGVRPLWAARTCRSNGSGTSCSTACSATDPSRRPTTSAAWPRGAIKCVRAASAVRNASMPTCVRGRQLARACNAARWHRGGLRLRRWSAWPDMRGLPPGNTRRLLARAVGGCYRRFRRCQVVLGQRISACGHASVSHAIASGTLRS